MAEIHRIQLHEKQFVPFISKEEIAEIVADLAKKIDLDYKDRLPLMVPILNGSYIFSADLTRAMTIPFEISFIKASSYQGTESTGQVNTLIGFNSSVKGRHLILVEDIVDTGNTMVKLFHSLETLEPASVTIVTLLIKEDVYDKDIPIDYKGKNIPNKFVVGYGLDYDELGRGIDAIYVLAED